MADVWKHNRPSVVEWISKRWYVTKECYTAVKPTRSIWMYKNMSGKQYQEKKSKLQNITYQMMPFMLNKNTPNNTALCLWTYIWAVKVKKS